MTATADQIAELRRMTAEPTITPYSHDILEAIIERYPRLDANGEDPYTWDKTTTPPTQTANPKWSPTYDLNAAAADVWNEKASATAADFDFSADGGNYHRSQRFEQYMKQARYYRSRASAKTGTLHKWPKETGPRDFPWIGNLPEDDD
jgi:hypothetical protein